MSRNNAAVSIGALLGALVVLAAAPGVTAQLEPGPPGTVVVSTAPAVETPLVETPGLRIAQDASIPALVVPEPVYGHVAGLRVDHPPVVQFWLTYHGWYVNVLDLWFSNNYSNEYIQNGNRFTVAGWQSFDGETHWHSRWAVDLPARFQEVHTASRGAPNMTPYWHPTAYRIHDETPNVHYAVRAREAGLAVNDPIALVESEPMTPRLVAGVSDPVAHPAGTLDRVASGLEPAALAPAPAPPRVMEARRATPRTEDKGATLASLPGAVPVRTHPAGLALVAAGAVVAGWFLGLLASSRLVRHRILQQRTRAAIFETIDRHPGRTLAEIAPLVGVRRQTVAYHVRVLVNERYVVTRRWGERTLHFASGSRDATASFSRLVVGRSDRANAILETIVENPGITSSTIAERLDLGRSTVRWHLQKLEASKLVVSRRAGANVELRAADSL